MSEQPAALDPPQIERRRVFRREVDRSRLSDAEWRLTVEQDLQSDARATRGLARALKSQDERLKKVEAGVSGLTDKVDEIAVMVGEHTPISVDDGAYLAMLRTQYPPVTMAKISDLVHLVEQREQAASEHWDLVKEMFKYVVGGFVSLCVLTIGFQLQSQRLISTPEMLGGAVALLLAGFVVYGLISGKAASFAKGKLP